MRQLRADRSHKRERVTSLLTQKLLDNRRLGKYQTIDEAVRKLSLQTAKLSGKTLGLKKQLEASMYSDRDSAD